MRTAKEILCEVFEAYGDDLQLNITLNPSVSLIEQAMEAYHEDKTRWISVSERLPEIEILERNDINNSLPVIALLKNGEVYKMVLSHWYEDEPNIFSWVYSDSGEIENNVTHWQPLPKLTHNNYDI